MERCSDHSAHCAMFEAQTKRQDDHERDSREVRARLFESIEDLKKNYLGEALKRLPQWGTIMLMFFTGLSSALIMFVVTHK